MIQGIGIDLIEVQRIGQALSRGGERFLKRVFTSREQVNAKEHSESRMIEHYAGKFAAKEAVVKALGSGLRGMHWTDIEILKEPSGKPVVALSQELEIRFDYPMLFISITHTRTLCFALCLWQSK
jgi:holo-[acyl-carrier protein] synthase